VVLSGVPVGGRVFAYAFSTLAQMIGFAGNVKLVPTVKVTASAASQLIIKTKVET
jgi:hypothetical protein